METRIRTTISLPSHLMGSLREEAKRKKKSLSKVVEEKLMETDVPIPNDLTMVAIEEARNGDNLEVLSAYDLEHFEEYVAGL